MKPLARGLVLLCGLGLMTGCGITGQWKMHSIEPEQAKEHFQIHWMTLNNDGTYKACAMEGGQHRMLKGTYTYDAKEKVLTFTTDGKTRSYHAELVGLGGELKVTGGEKGKEWTAMMKRGDSCECQEKGKPCPEHMEKKPEPTKEPAAKSEVKKEAPAKAEAKKTEPPKKEEKKPAKKAEEPKKEEAGKKG